jgi:NCS1 family nucleobase:cation symporter-1
MWEDLKPTPAKVRTWGARDYLTLWLGMGISVPAWMLGGSMIAAGFDWAWAVTTVLLGQLIVLVPLILNSFPGARYGIPFPVLLRASFGPRGAHLPAMMRSLVGCGWFGIQTWIGGLAMDRLLLGLTSGWEGVPYHTWIAFASFWLLSMALCYLSPPARAMPGMRWALRISAPALFAVGLGLLLWSVSRAGWGPLMAQPMGFEAFSPEFWRLFLPSLTAMVAFWSTFAVNISDLTRFARDQRAQVLGQALGLPSAMTAFAFMGIASASASALIFGVAIWDPTELCLRTGSGVFVSLGLIFIILSTMVRNLAANVVAPAYGFANLWPRRVSFWRGALLTGILGVAIMPWRLLESYGAYVYDWLGTYGAFLGAIAGVLIADYWLVKGRRLRLRDLYSKEGIYRYVGGVNPLALVALTAGIAFALFIPGAKACSWFVSFGVGLALYSALMKVKGSDGRKCPI